MNSLGYSFQTLAERDRAKKRERIINRLWNIAGVFMLIAFGAGLGFAAGGWYGYQHRKQFEERMKAEVKPAWSCKEAARICRDDWIKRK